MAACVLRRGTPLPRGAAPGRDCLAEQGLPLEPRTVRVRVLVRPRRQRPSQAVHSRQWPRGARTAPPLASSRVPQQPHEPRESRSLDAPANCASRARRARARAAPRVRLSALACVPRVDPTELLRGACGSTTESAAVQWSVAHELLPPAPFRLRPQSRASVAAAVRCEQQWARTSRPRAAVLPCLQWALVLAAKPVRSQAPPPSHLKRSPRRWTSIPPSTRGSPLRLQPESAARTRRASAATRRPPASLRW